MTQNTAIPVTVAPAASSSTVMTMTSHSSIGPLLKLARVEIQSIMQFLPRASLIRFSRCSHTLYADGDTDVAWHTQSLYEFRLSDLLPLVNLKGVFRPSLFLRRQPGFSLRGQVGRLGASVKFLLTLFESIPRLKRMTFTSGWFDNADNLWQCLLMHSDLNHLEELHLSCACCNVHISNLLTLIQRWPNLRALTLPSSMVYDSVVRLQTFPSLRYLGISVDAELSNDECSISASIAMHCEHLTSLTISNSSLLKPEAFHRVFTSPNLSKLRELSLTRWQWFNDADLYDEGITYARDDPATFELIRRTWTSMRQLERLILASFPEINLLLPTFTSGHFKEIVLSLSRPFLRSSDSTVESLDQLLTQMPNLCVIVSTHSETIAQRFDRLQTVFGHRFQGILHPTLQTFNEWKPPPLDTDLAHTT